MSQALEILHTSVEWKEFFLRGPWLGEGFEQETHGGGEGWK